MTPGNRLALVARILGIVACSIAVIAVAITALGFILADQAIMMVTSLVLVPLSVILAGLIGLVGVVLAVVDGARARRVNIDGQPGKALWKRALLWNIVGMLALPAGLLIIMLGVAVETSVAGGS